MWPLRATKSPWVPLCGDSLNIKQMDPKTLWCQDYQIKAMDCYNSWGHSTPQSHTSGTPGHPWAQVRASSIRNLSQGLARTPQLLLWGILGHLSLVEPRLQGQVSGCAPCHCDTSCFAHDEKHQKRQGSRRPVSVGVLFIVACVFT